MTVRSKTLIILAATLGALALVSVIASQTGVLPSFAKLGLLVGGLVLVAVAWLVVDRSVLAPLGRLSAQVRAIRTSGDPSARVSYGGRDELGTMAAEINGMLESLERSQQMLRQRERLRQAAELLDELPAYAYLKDDQGRYLMANRLLCQALGKTAEDVIGCTDSDLFPEAVARRYREKERSVLHSGTCVFVGEESFLDGGRQVKVSTRLVPIRDLEGRVSGLAGLRFNITELRATQEQLARLATAVEQVGEAVVITDTGGTVQYVNPAFEQITALGRDEALGRNIRELEGGELPSEYCDEIWRALERGDPWRGRFANRRKDGTVVQVECAGYPVRDETGAIVSYVAIERDVSREISLERQLRQAHKLEALGTLAGGIAHDFNNILTPIVLGAEAALEEAAPGGRQERFLRRVLSEALRGREVVHQILAFSRQSEGEPRVIHLTPLLKETLALMRVSLPATVELRRHIDVSTDTVLADPTHIHQVLVNLVTNAAQAVGQTPGAIDVTLSEVDVDPPGASSPHGLAPGSYLVIAVRDTGSGMTSEVEERIFEPFFTTRATGEGAGLGLSVVHGIVDGAGGSVEVESERDRGTTVRVYLPKTAPTEPKEPVAERAPARGTERILFVDDEPDTVQMAGDVLGELGYRFTGVTTAEEALRVFRQGPDGFDVVITDQSMPKMTGIQLAGQILQTRPDVPVILYTGHEARECTGEARAQGIRRVLPKPLTVSELTSAVREVLETRVKG